MPWLDERRGQVRGRQEHAGRLIARYLLHTVGIATAAAALDADVSAMAEATLGDGCATRSLDQSRGGTWSATMQKWSCASRNLSTSACIVLLLLLLFISPLPHFPFLPFITSISTALGPSPLIAAAGSAATICIAAASRRHGHPGTGEREERMSIYLSIYLSIDPRSSSSSLSLVLVRHCVSQGW